MSDRKRKAAICCLIAASFLAMERRKKRKRELRNEYESKHLNAMMDADNTSDCDQDDIEDEEDEEENYETSINSGVTIKIEPGLNEEDSIDEYNNLNEEGRDPLEIDIDNSMTIKQEKHGNDESSSDLGMKIKVEPDFSDDDINNFSSQNYENDSSENCSPSKENSHERHQSSKEVSVDVKTNKVTNTENVKNIKTGESVVKETNEVRDDCQVFGDFVAGELRNLRSEDNRKKLKRIIQKVIIEIAESED